MLTGLWCSCGHSRCLPELQECDAVPGWQLWAAWPSEAVQCAWHLSGHLNACLRLGCRDAMQAYCICLGDLPGWQPNIHVSWALECNAVLQVIGKRAFWGVLWCN